MTENLQSISIQLSRRRNLTSAFYFNELPFRKTIICKVERLNIKQRRSNSVDLRCLQKPIIIACGSEKVVGNAQNVTCKYPLTSHFSVGATINPFTLSGLFYHNSLDRSVSNSRVSG